MNEMFFENSKTLLNKGFPNKVFLLLYKVYIKWEKNHGALGYININKGIYKDDIEFKTEQTKKCIST